MNEAVPSRWIFVRRENGEHLYRARLLGCSGRIVLPGGAGSVRFERREGGELTVSMDGALAVRAFEYGAVLVRDPVSLLPMIASRSGRPRHWIAALVLALFALGAAYVEIQKFFDVPPPPAAVFPSPPRAFPETPVQAPAIFRSQGKKERRVWVGKRKAENSGWAIRAAFLSGHLERAEELIEGARSQNGGRLSGALREIGAEVKYAGCRRAYLRKEWAAAVRACEEADREIFHKRAKLLLAKLGARARKLFLEGYVMESTNPKAAFRRYRETLAGAPTDSPYREKAAAKLKLIRGVKFD